MFRSKLANPQSASARSADRELGEGASARLSTRLGPLCIICEFRCIGVVRRPIFLCNAFRECNTISQIKDVTVWATNTVWAITLLREVGYRCYIPSNRSAITLSLTIDLSQNNEWSVTRRRKSPNQSSRTLTRSSTRYGFRMKPRIIRSPNSDIAVSLL
jgi:hypothetical protein